jgi:hypothetical protein
MRLQQRRIPVGLALAVVFGSALLLGQPASAATPGDAARSAPAGVEQNAR